MLVDDSIDVSGLPTSAGSIALENDFPSGDAKLVAELEQAGAIILGDTNTTELDGEFGANMPPGYSSLGGQALLPPDTNSLVRRLRGARRRPSPPASPRWRSASRPRRKARR